MATSFPGYEYDEKRKCYFRVPPKHLGSHHNHGDKDSCGSTGPTEPKVTTCSGYSLYRLTQSRKLEMRESTDSLRLLKECLVPRKTGAELKLACPNTNIHFEDILLDESGEGLATKYLHNGNRFCELSSIKKTKSGMSCELFMKLKLTTVAQGYHSMDYATDELIHFSYLRYILVFTSTLQSDKTIFFAQQTRDNSKLKDTTTITKSASSIKFEPKHDEWSRSYYAIGLPKGVAQIYNSHHRRTFTSSVINSDILSLAFSLQDPVLFAGYRNGTCHVWDTRTRSPPAMTLTEESKSGTTISSSIIALHPSLDSNSIILNSLNSNLSVWDVRMQRRVLQFYGHVNEYRTCKSLVDKMESFIVAVGSDGDIRHWSIRTGDLLCCLNTGTSEVPHIAYADSLGGALGRPSLLVTSNRSISVYQNAA